MGSLILHVLKGPWFMVFGTILIMAAAGATYMFGSYSGKIKQSLGYDQTTLNTLSFFKDLGANIAIHCGLIMEVTPPWFVLLLGAILNLFGYVMTWLAVTKRISTNVWQMCLYSAIGANSQSFANTGALVTCVKNFPESRGAVLGLLKGFVGLSGAIITQIYNAIYGGENPEALILLIGWLPTIISIVFLRTIRYMKVERKPNELKVFYKFLYAALGLAGFLMIIIIVQKNFSFNQTEYIIGAAIMAILMLLPLGIVLKEETYSWRIKKLGQDKVPEIKVVNDNNSEESVPPPPPPPPPDVDETKQPSCWKTGFQPPARGDDFTILQALFSVDMMILLMTAICGIGGTLTAVDNLGQIGASLGYPKKSISTFVSLISIWSFLGRVAAGFVSEHLLRKYKFPRTLMLTLTLAVSCIGHLLIAFDVPNGLYVATVIIGFCFGAQWPLLFAIISELFGLKYFSTLYNIGTVASPIGLYVLNVRVTGYLYDREAERQMRALGITRKEGESLDCNGAKCFRLAFIIITCATVFGAFVSTILVVRTRKFYKSDIYKKFKEENKEIEGTEDMEMTKASSGSGTKK